ncbi:protein SLOW GREEN 1, chloroplastic [Lactuca sativa]|nr:protein SLOW GREEN 1, chloroplastic [Lactuca sativa]
MELALTNATYRHLPRPLSLQHHRRPSSKSIAFLKTTSFSSLTPIKASFRNPNYQTPKPEVTKIVNPTPLSFLKTTFITGVAVTALCFSRFTLKPAIAVPVSSPPPPATVETADTNSESLEEEKNLEEHLCSHPEDINALKSLMELKIKNGKIHEAIGILSQLINLEPEDSEWQLLKYHLHSYSGDHDSAKLGFEQILAKDPLRVEAYHGLVMAASAKESPNDLKDVEKRIIEGMEKCKKEKKKDDLRDFKLLLAQIRVIQGDYNDALKIYQDLSKEEARDFRPYLCQGIIYTLLGKNDDAEKSFEKYRRLVPKGHPYTRYFDDNMVATKVFAQKVENERAYSKS